MRMQFPLLIQSVRIHPSRPITGPMPLAITEVAPGRLEIREGGGCLTLFGLPFLAVGIYASLATLGFVVMRNEGQAVTHAAAVVFAVLFTLVGGVLTFGRSITA